MSPSFHRLASGDVTAFDCYSKDVREPFRACVTALADAIQRMFTDMPSGSIAGRLRSADHNRSGVHK